MSAGGQGHVAFWEADGTRAPLVPTAHVTNRARCSMAGE